MTSESTPTPPSVVSGQPIKAYARATEVVNLPIDEAQVASYERVGDDMVVTLKNGKVEVVKDYYAPGAEKELHLNGQQVDFVNDAQGTLTPIEGISGGAGLAPLALGGLALGGIAAVVSS